MMVPWRTALRAVVKVDAKARKEGDVYKPQRDLFYGSSAPFWRCIFKVQLERERAS